MAKKPCARCAKIRSAAKLAGKKFLIKIKPKGRVK